MTFQVVSVYKELIQNSIEVGSCQAVSQCPQGMTSSDSPRINLGLLEKELPGYLWYKALTTPANWGIIISLLLAIISIKMQIRDC